MQIQNHYLDDIAHFASSIVSVLSNIRRETEEFVGQQLEQILAKTNVASRDELEMLQAIVRIARSNQEHLERRLSILEINLSKDTKCCLPRRRATINLRLRIRRARRGRHSGLLSL